MKLSRNLNLNGQWAIIVGYGLLIFLLVLPLLTSLLRWNTVPCTHDGHLHYHRIVAMRYAWESGLPFSRWLPDVAFGYGYPFFNYREAIPLYMSLIPHLLGVALPAALNLFYALTILAAGWFMFLWVSDIFGPISGIVSAVAYMAAPYQFIDALIRGNRPESLALALFPLLFWASRRYILRGSSAYFLISVLGLALLALSHNISIMLFVPFLFLYILALGLWHRLQWKTVALRSFLLFGLGLGLSLFYAGPALLELDEITISQSVIRRGNDFHFNFASLGEIFAPVNPADPSLLNPPLNIRLGLIPVALAFLGVISLIWIRSRERRGHIIFMGLAALALLFMSSPASLFLWENLPLIDFVQFPWRFIGRAALPIAFLAGVPFNALPQIWSGRFLRTPLFPALVVAAIILLLIEAIPMTYPHQCNKKAQPTIDGVHSYESSSGLVGVDPEGSYFPKTVLSRPDSSPLEADYKAGQIPQRFDISVLPQNAKIQDINYSPLSTNVAIESPSPFEARYLSFAFPGWQAKVDGETVAITPSEPEGLITFEVPAGEHALEVRWGTTPLRLIMNFLSLIAFGGLIVVTIHLTRKRHSSMPGSELHLEEEASVVPEIAHSVLGILFVVAVVFFVVKMGVLDRIESPLRRESLPSLGYPQKLKAAELQLEGFELSQDSASAGETFDIDLAWRVSEPPVADYQSNVWLVGPDGQIWSDKETARPRIYEDTSRTSFWLPGQWAWDSREVRILEGTPPGQYDIVMILFNKADLQPVTLKALDGTVLGPEFVVGQIEVVRPDSPPVVDPQYPLHQAIDDLTLLGFNQDRQQAAPGDEFSLTFFWEKSTDSQSPLTEFRLALLDDSEQAVQSWTLSPARVDYPSSDWREGEIVRGQHRLRLAAGLSDGLHRFVLEDFPLSELQINAPDRIFDEPAFVTTSRAIFGDMIELVGYTVESDVSSQETPFSISLVWKGLTELPVSYRVFVHLVDEDGRILDQSDAEPAGWTRPTTGWAPQEYVIDSHQLIPIAEEDVGDRFLRVGLYDASSGQRLAIDGAEFLVLPLGNN